VLDERQSRLEQDALIRDLILERLGERDAGVMDIVGTFTLDGYTFSAGAVQIVRAVLRDLRWHAERYGAWAADGELDVERLRELCDAWSPASDDLTCQRCAVLIRLAHTAQARWLDHMREENVRDFDALILDTRDLLDGAAWQRRTRHAPPALPHPHHRRVPGHGRRTARHRLCDRPRCAAPAAVLRR
jgi:hypothetical protein